MFLCEESPDTLLSMCNLAVAYWNQNKRDLALELMDHALRLSSKLVGIDHHPYKIGAVNLYNG